MGKKSRKKKGVAALASDIDNTICADCGIDVDPFHWDYESCKILECCGASLCGQCNQDKRKRRRDATGRSRRYEQERAESLVPHATPELNTIYRDDVGPCSSCGKAATVSSVEHVSRLKRLADAGHSHSQFTLAVRYEYGHLELRKNEKLAVKWYRKAAEQGHLTACAQMGDYFRVGAGVKQSYAEAKRWYERGGNQAVALCGMGDLHYYGDGGERDKAKALEFYHKAADQDYPFGLLSYGDLLLELGRTEEALVQYEKGARLERHVVGDFLRSIAICQLRTAVCLEIIHDGRAREEEDTGNDPFPLMLFWARRAVQNGNEEALECVSRLEAKAHAECRHCKKPNPQMKCSKCQGASYCDRSCQKAAWKAGHKKVCNGLPNIVSRDECAAPQCREPSPKYVCQGCSKVYYCDEDCQQSHWQEGHKDACKVFQAI